MRKVSYLSYNMTTADANNPDGIVPVGRQFDFIGDVETEEMILVDGDESLCLGYEDVKIYQDVYVGDMMEYKATLTHIGNTSRDCRIEVFKLATPAYRAGKEDYKPGDMVWFDEPVLCTEGWLLRNTYNVENSQMEQLLIHGVIWMIFQKMNKVHKTD